MSALEPDHMQARCAVATPLTISEGNRPVPFQGAIASELDIQQPGTVSLHPVRHFATISWTYVEMYVSGG